MSLKAHDRELHGTLSGSTTRKLCERAFKLHGDVRFERQATLSSGHLYNLRGHKTYRAVRGGEAQRGVSAARLAALLEKLRIEQTKSRSRQSNDNALAESKNASTIRKHLGYSHIPQHLANGHGVLLPRNMKRPRHDRSPHPALSRRRERGHGQRCALVHVNQVNAFTADVLSPYLSYHRPCHFPTEFTDEKGKILKRYHYADMMTQYDKLKSLPDAAGYLRPGVIFDRLDEITLECSDNEAARRINEARTTSSNSSTIPYNAPPDSTPFTHLAQAHVWIGKCGLENTASNACALNQFADRPRLGAGQFSRLDDLHGIALVKLVVFIVSVIFFRHPDDLANDRMFGTALDQNRHGLVHLVAHHASGQRAHHFLDISHT
jgi:hypothetical protein